MRLRWNGEMKRLAAVFGFFGLAVLLLGNLAAVLYRDGLRRNYNESLAAVIGNVKANYPDVEEETLLRELRLGGNEERGRAFLERYGILTDQNGDTFSGMERGLSLAQAGINVFGGLLLLGAGGMLYVYLGKRQRRIEELTEYMEALGRGNYTLEIEDNADDELSGLRNEIYRLTVGLKEQASLAVTQKKALADSVADISHQLKTPLTSVMVLADNLSENTDMEESTRKRFMGEIVRQLSGMSWLVAAMLKLSRLEAGVVELKRERVSLRTLTERALEKLELEAEWREIAFQVRQDKEIYLTADESWTTEALVNLLKNALEHSFRGERVELSCAENDIYVQIQITDHGEGMSEQDRRRLFQRFYRGGTAREDSAGIGLALAKEIIEKQNGYISVDSEAGKGTSFVIRFMKNSFA